MEEQNGECSLTRAGSLAAALQNGSRPHSGSSNRKSPGGRTAPSDFPSDEPLSQGEDVESENIFVQNIIQDDFIDRMYKCPVFLQEGKSIEKLILHIYSKKTIR